VSVLAVMTSACSLMPAHETPVVMEHIPVPALEQDCGNSTRSRSAKFSGLGRPELCSSWTREASEQ
jgi:hypothetical protein